MTKEEILAKSRNENKGKDIESLEVAAKAGNITVIVSVVFALGMFITQAAVNGTVNWPLWAMLNVMNLSMQAYQAVKLKKPANIVAAVSWGVASVLILIPTFSTILGYGL